MRIFDPWWWLKWFLIICVVMWVVNNPGDAASKAEGFGHLIGKAGHSVVIIIDRVTNS